MALEPFLKKLFFFLYKVDKLAIRTKFLVHMTKHQGMVLACIKRFHLYITKVHIVLLSPTIIKSFQTIALKVLSHFKHDINIKYTMTKCHMITLLDRMNLTNILHRLLKQDIIICVAMLLHNLSPNNKESQYKQISL